MPAIIEPVGPPEPGAQEPPLSSRLIWFAGLALAGLVTTGLAAYALRVALFLG